MTCLAKQFSFREHSSLFPAITFGFIRASLVEKGGLVLGFDDAGYSWEAAVAHFVVVSVKYFVKFV